MFNYEEFVRDCEYIFETPDELVRQLNLSMEELLEALLPLYSEEIAKFFRLNVEELRESFDEYYK